MLLYLGQGPNWVVIQLNTELQLPETLSDTIKQIEIPLSLFKKKIKSIKIYVRDITFQKECSVIFNIRTLNFDIFKLISVFLPLLYTILAF